MSASVEALKTRSEQPQSLRKETVIQQDGLSIGVQVYRSAGQPDSNAQVEVHVQAGEFDKEKSPSDEVAMVRYAQGGGRIDRINLGRTFAGVGDQKVSSPEIVVTPEFYGGHGITHHGFTAETSLTDRRNGYSLQTDAQQKGVGTIVSPDGTAQYRLSWQRVNASAPDTKTTPFQKLFRRVQREKRTQVLQVNQDLLTPTGEVAQRRVIVVPLDIQPEPVLKSAEFSTNGIIFEHGKKTSPKSALENIGLRVHYTSPHSEK